MNLGSAWWLFKSSGEIGFGADIGSLENPVSPFLKSFDEAQRILFKRFVLHGLRTGKTFLWVHRKNVEPPNPLTGAYLPCCGDQGALKALFLGRTQRSSTIQPLVQSASTPIPRELPFASLWMAPLITYLNWTWVKNPQQIAKQILTWISQTWLTVCIFEYWFISGPGQFKVQTIRILWTPFSPTSSPAPEVARLAGLPALRPGARSGDAATHDGPAELQPTHRGGLGGCLGETCRPERMAMDGRGEQEEVNLCGQQI